MRLPRMRNVMAWTLVVLLLIVVALLGDQQYGAGAGFIGQGFEQRGRGKVLGH